MSEEKELQQINNELTEEFRKLTQGGFNNQMMWNGFVQDKLSEFELRLRKLEKSNGRTQSYLDMHTPLI